MGRMNDDDTARRRELARALILEQAGRVGEIEHMLDGPIGDLARAGLEQSRLDALAIIREQRALIRELDAGDV